MKTVQMYHSAESERNFLSSDRIVIILQTP